MAEESKMCFMSVANRPYQQYVPWFLYFLNRAYPQARKLILLDTSLNERERQMLGLLDGNHEVRENAFPEYQSTDGDTIKCLRWMTFDPSFDNYDCLSIGDIDMATYVETPSYMEQHLSHCRVTGLPYSNFIRPPKAGPRRVGGIHVVKPREWFKVMLPVIERYRAMLVRGQIHLPRQGFNEQVLLRMIVESEFGEPPPNLSSTYWESLVSSNHHGTHIRLAQHGGMRGLSGANGYRLHKDQIIAAANTPLFRELMNMSPQIGTTLAMTAMAYKSL